MWRLRCLHHRSKIKQHSKGVKSYDTDHHSRDVDHPLDNGLIFCNYFEELGVQK